MPAGVPPPALRTPLPVKITFQRKSANRRVINEGRLISMLQTFGEVRRPIAVLGKAVIQQQETCLCC